MIWGMKFLWALAGAIFAVGAFAAEQGATNASVVHPDVPAINLQASPEIEAAMRKLRLQAGFQAQLVASEPLIANPTAFAFDEQGRAYVVETHRRRSSVFDIRNHPAWVDADFSFRTVLDRANFLRSTLNGTNAGVPKNLQVDRNGDGRFDFRDLEVESERVRLLLDRDGNGVMDSATTFAEDFRSIVSGVAAGVVARGGNVWFASIPDLWRLRDSNADNKADVRDKLLTGFGVHIAFGGHDLHGLKFGPDGKLYFSIADRGLNVTNANREFANPDSGAIMRCNPDGTEFEIVATGLRNPQELAFDQYGNLFTGDNNGDGGDKARWVYVVEGLDAGWHIGWQHAPKMGAWNAEQLWALAPTNTAAYILPPVAHIGHGPAGIAYYPGVGLPLRYTNHFFMADFPGGVRSFAMLPRGATFEAYDVHDFAWELYPSDVDFGPNGGLYVLDWVQGWEKTGKGRLYRVFDPVAAADPLVQDSKVTLAGGVANRTLPQFTKLLGHADMRVRLEAQFTFVEVGVVATNQLMDVARRDKNELARLHALWAIGQLGRTNAGAALLVQPFLTDAAAAEMRAHAARLAGDLRVDTAGDQLVALLKDPSPRVRFFAAQSLGKLRRNDAAPAIFALLDENADRDAYIRHACVMALVAFNDVNLVTRLFREESRALRMAAALALRRMGRPEISPLLYDEEPAIVLEAARAIHDVPIERAMPQLATLVTRTNVAEPVLRRALNANFRVGHLENGIALTTVATRTNAPDWARADAVKYLSQWEKPPARDAVLGLWRPIAPRDARAASLALRGELDDLLLSGPEAVRLAAAEAALKLDASEASGTMFQLVSDVKAPVALRITALRALRGFKSALLQEAIKIASVASDEALRKEATQITATTARPANAAAEIMKKLDTGTIAEKQAAFVALGDLPGFVADSMFVMWLDRLQTGKLDPALRVDLIEAAAKRKDTGIQAALKKYEDSLPKDDPLAPYRVALAGGDREAGKKIFAERADVACARCHKVTGQVDGGEVGPDLAKIGEKGRDYILESIVLPNKTIAPGFESIVVKTKDGVVHAGVVKSETDAALEINSLEDGLVKIDKAQIAARDKGLSAMPAEIPTMLTKRELRDVVEFLAAQK